MSSTDLMQDATLTPPRDCSFSARPAVSMRLESAEVGSMQIVTPLLAAYLPISVSASFRLAAAKTVTACAPAGCGRNTVR